MSKFENDTVISYNPLSEGDFVKCFNYVESQMECGASPAFAMAHVISDRLCKVKNMRPPYKQSVQSISN